MRIFRILTYCLLWFFFLGSSLLLYTQEQPMDIEPVTFKHGTMDRTIFCIFQDKKGFIWLGTDNGLNKYDGYTIETYRYQPDDPNSLSNNSVRTINEDEDGNLWIGTFGGGLEKFNVEREIFTHFKNNPENPNSLSDDFVLTIHHTQSPKGEELLWIGTFRGLDRYELKTNKIEHYQFTDEESGYPKVSVIRTIYEDRNGFLWLGTLGSGLIMFLPETGDYERYRSKIDRSEGLSHNDVLTIQENADGMLWIGTAGGGLERFSPKTKQFNHLRANAFEKNSLNSDDVRILHLQDNKFLWIGTGAGLSCFDLQKKEFIRFSKESTEQLKLHHNTIISLYEDQTGIIWIGTLFNGLYKLDRQKKKFISYRHSDKDSNSLIGNMVEAIYEDKEGILWLGTSRGLDKWNEETGIFTHYREKANDTNSLSNNYIWCLLEDREDKLWIGTMKGLNSFDRATDKFVRFFSNPLDSNTISHNKVLALYEDREGILWVGTYNGLNRFSADRTTFERYKNDPQNPGSLSNDLIISLLVDSEQRLWVGTVKGLNLYSRKSETFKRYLVKTKKGLINDKINYIYEDKTGTLWLGTYGGLHKYDEKNDRFSHYEVQDGLFSNVILGILEDELGNLWLSTTNGLSVFSPKTRVFKTYDTSDGLQDNEFRKACWKNKEGQMFFGGVNGFNSFYPERVVDNPYPPLVLITGLSIANEPVTVGEPIDGSVVLKKEISQIKEINLSFKHRTLAFDYVALHYAAPESNRYAYKMEGVDKDWNYVGGNRQAFYSYLNAGTYVFHVKACNNDNLWNEKGASIKIHISPPFWKRWWFFVFLGIIFTSIVFNVIYFRTKWLREKLQEQERIQKLLEKSRDDMKISKEIAEFRGAENEKLIAAISSIFIKVDADGKISHWNHSAGDFFGIGADQVKGRSFVDVLKEYISIDYVEEIIEMGLKHDQASHNIEIPVDLKKENKKKQFLATINPIIDKKGNKFGFLLLGENITQQKKEQMRMLLSQKLEALGQMSAGIAHEIRSPLQYIGDNVQFLLDAFGELIKSCQKIDEWVKKSDGGGGTEIDKLNRALQDSEFHFFLKEVPVSLEQIQNGVIRVSNIVKSMSKLSYICEEVDEKANLNELLKTTLVVAHNRIKNVAEVETDFGVDLPSIYCAIGELSQVFLNLLINAADAVAETGKRGRIKITTKQVENELVIEISDNGIGIPDAIKDKIFASFFTTKRLGHGTGQGLPFSYNIVVERHKGKLYFESEEQRGTTFFIHLPIGEDIPDD